jgi:glycosyltransferase involved in cell wall biosynthesis
VALRSVLAERNLDLDVCVVDDASDDGTAAEVTAIADPRVRLLRSQSRRGIGWCHNLVMRESSAPFVTHVDADDWIVPGALPRMVAALEAAPRAAQAYCDFVPAGAAGEITAPDEWRRYFGRMRRPPIDHRRQLLLYGMVVNHLRTYRREALDQIGGFDETLPWGVDYDAALRLAEEWEFVHVPEPLYVKRILPTGASESVRFKDLRFWALRWRLARRALHRNGGRALGMSAMHVHLLLLAGLLDATGLVSLVRRLRAPPRIQSA